MEVEPARSDSTKGTRDAEDKPKTRTAQERPERAAHDGQPGARRFRRFEAVMHLNDDELREVFARAEEIQRTSLPSSGPNTELEAVIEAGQEVGLSRPAIERALRERLEFFAAPPAVGARVFARSADDKYYAAEVVSVAAEEVRVRFLEGAEHSVTMDQLRPFAIIPGARIACYWPWWGPWTCTVVSYDAARQKVKLTDGWGSTHSVRISEVWLPRPRTKTPSRARIYARLLGAGAAVGALIGAIVTAIVMS
jgi:hypothetical protein